MALGDARHVRGLATMRDAFQLREDSETREICILDAAHFEDMKRTDFDAIGFSLALRSIDDRREFACG
jgi:hypothetical protein